MMRSYWCSHWSMAASDWKTEMRVLGKLEKQGLIQPDQATLCILDTDTLDDVLV